MTSKKLPTAALINGQIWLADMARQTMNTPFEVVMSAIIFPVMATYISLSNNNMRQ